MGRRTRICTAVFLVLLACAPVAYACRSRRPPVTVNGVPTSCDGERFTVRASVSRWKVEGISITLDGRVVARDDDQAVTASIACRGLDEGSHELGITAKDSLGRKGSRVLVFER
ncbi:MAG TPA: hypothetical protein VF520_14630 [Thermoleophilaceae bacterium]